MNLFFVKIWYAEHESVGDKFYKVVTIANRDAKKSFSLINFGPRAVHVGLHNVSTGQGSVENLCHGTTAGQQKVREKSVGGYRKNVQTEQIEFISHGDLVRWCERNIGTKYAAVMRARLNDVSFCAVRPGAADDLPGLDPVPDDGPGPSFLDQHPECGSW